MDLVFLGKVAGAVKVYRLHSFSAMILYWSLGRPVTDFSCRYYLRSSCVDYRAILIRLPVRYNRVVSNKVTAETPLTVVRSARHWGRERTVLLCYRRVLRSLTMTGKGSADVRPWYWLTSLLSTLSVDSSSCHSCEQTWMITLVTPVSKLGG